jgi:hypothetical protein
VLLLHKKKRIGKSTNRLFFTIGLLGHFNITNVEELGEVSTKTMIIQVELEEINIIPNGYALKSMC